MTPGAGAGYALQFDGINDLVELNYTAYIFGVNSGWQNTKTVSLWVRPTGTATVCPYSSVATCSAIFGDRPRWWGISRGVIGGLDRIWVWNTDGSPNSYIDTFGVSYTPGEWVHISIVHNNGVIRVYKNGAEVGAFASGTTQQPNTGAYPKLHLGGIINSSTAKWLFEGQIDEVSLWSVARTQAEIQQGMLSTLSGAEFGLAAYYRMSNGSGTVLTDDSVYFWDGLLYDGARGVPPNGAPPLWITPGPF
jgi:hypothetical protein